jgi:hypothetical protein
MKNNKLKLNGTMLSGLIIIISFVYAINIQPKVIGDSENLKQVSKVIICNNGKDNPMLYKENQLLVNPVSPYEIREEIKQHNNGYIASYYECFKLQNAYIYKLFIENQFGYQDRIKHLNEDELLDVNYQWVRDSSIHNFTYSFYTIYNDIIRMNNISQPSEINSIDLK